MDHSIHPSSARTHPHRHRTLFNPHSFNIPHSPSHSHHPHPSSLTASHPIGHFNGPIFRGTEGEREMGLQSQKKLPGVGVMEVMPVNKHKRHTFPPLQVEPFSRQLLPPTVQSPLSRKITFTYRSPSNNAHPPPSLPAALPQHPKTHVFQSCLQPIRTIRNELCPLQFSFFYNPNENIKQEVTFNEAKTGLNTSLHANMEQKQGNFASSSKMASTIATQSFNQNRRSDFPPQDYKGIEASLMGYFYSNQKSNLTDQIPRAKQLGDTVILNNHYSFGGIIHNTPQEHSLFERERGVVQECELRRWNNPVRSLLDDRGSQDLKQSIHEGPEIRMEHHRFEMLDGFGREIKESTMSILP